MSTTSTLPGTGDTSAEVRPTGSRRSRRTAWVWAAIAAACLAVGGLAAATFAGNDAGSGDNPAPETEDTGTQTTTGNGLLPGSHNVPQ